MGFNVGRFIGAIAPFVGGAIAGPMGATIGAGVSAALLRPTPAPAPLPARTVAPQQALRSTSGLTSLVPVPMSRFQVPVFRPRQPAALTARTAVEAVGIGGALMSFFGGEDSISEILNQARQTFGRGVTKNKIIDAAKVCGIGQAADTFGISESQVCRVIVAGRTRRRRGISAADIRRTRRTLRTVKSIRSDLKAIRL